jgi:LPS sulfotransferase NodH
MALKIRAAQARSAPPGLARKLVWMFGSPRTGSTWLMKLLADSPEVGQIDEPYVPLHLVPVSHVADGGEYYEHNRRATDPNYFFAKRYLRHLKPQLRDLVLAGFDRQLSELGEKPDRLRWVIVKEPNGSHAADSLMSLLPDSRMIFLLRDGRDVIDSLVDAMMSKDSWWNATQTSATARVPAERRGFIRHNAQLWLGRTEATQRAYASTPASQRMLVRYEELLADTEEVLGSLLSWLGLDAEPQRVREIAERHSFGAIPEDQRGPGKRNRSATPGGWRERLTGDELDLIEEIMGDKLRELGYGDVAASAEPAVSAAG